VVLRHEVSSKFNWQANYQLVDTERVYVNGPEGAGYQPEYVDYGMYGGHIDTVGVSANAQPLTWLGLTAGYEFEHELYSDHQDNNTPSPGRVAERTIRKVLPGISYTWAGGDDLHEQFLWLGRNQP